MQDNSDNINFPDGMCAPSGFFLYGCFGLGFCEFIFGQNQCSIVFDAVKKRIQKKEKLRRRYCKTINFAEQ